MKSKDITQSKNLVIKYLQSPDFKLAGKEIDGKITATFRVGEDGKIEVDKVSAPSPRLETYVTEKLSAIAATYDYKEVIHPYDQNFEVLIRFN
jgi:hypothetical protein